MKSRRLPGDQCSL